MPLVFAIISFFSYRYYRSYVYYKLIFIVYEALCLMAFLALMLAYVGNSTEEQMAVMQSKDKRPLPWPMGVRQIPLVYYSASKPCADDSNVLLSAYVIGKSMLSSADSGLSTDTGSYAGLANPISYTL